MYRNKIICLILVISVNLQSQNPFESIGILHNEAVKYVLLNVPKVPEAKDRATIIESTLRQKYSAEYFQGYQSFPSENLGKYLRDERLKNFSPTLNQKIDAVETFLKGNHSVSDIWTYIQTLEATVTTSVPSNEVDLYFYYLAVIKHSAKYWLPTSLGGEGGSDGITPAGGSARIIWGQVIGADAIGVLSGAAANLIATGGAGAIPNPLLGGVPTAGAVGVVVGAGASLNSIWSQWGK